MAKMLHLILLFLFLQSISSASSSGIRVELRRIDSDKDLTMLELLSRAADRTAISGRSLASRPTSPDVQAPLYAGDAGEFLMELAIGTPPLFYPGVMDTGSDLVWTQCQPCLQCLSQPTPFYSPSESTTYAPLPCPRCQALLNLTCNPNCSYYYSYAEQTYTQAILGTETFTFGAGASAPAPALVSDIIFGCGMSNGGSLHNSSGFVGMGRGPLSLVSQLGEGRFSYCLTPFGDNRTSPLLLGSSANLSDQARSTRFVSSPNLRPFSSYYYISLQGITVGTSMLPISNTTFALKANGTGGTIIDSGTTFTRLVEPAHAALKQAFASQLNLPMANGSAYGLDACFSFTSADEASLKQVPSLIFHFDGADMELPLENYVFADSSIGLLCVMILKSELPFSIFGSYQQQNMHVLYDVAGGMLSFEPAACDNM